MPICKPLSEYLIKLPSVGLAGSKCASTRPMQEGEAFGLGDTERALFDSLAQEHVGIIGTDIEYWPQAVTNNKGYLNVVDPLYNEPAKRAFLGPYLLKGYLSYPEHDPSPGQEGWSSQFDATAYITRAEFEKFNMGSPTESDIIRVWKTPYWNQVAVDGFDVPGSGLYFSIVSTKEDGVLFDTASFMGFTLTLRRTTQQTPERKIANTL